jgi:hypothetical protein
MSKNTDEQGNVISLLSEEDAKKYAGQHVCIIGFQDHTVISADFDPIKACQSAAAKGYKDPVTFYVPRPFDKFAFLETSEACTFR